MYMELHAYPYISFIDKSVDAWHLHCSYTGSMVQWKWRDEKRGRKVAGNIQHRLGSKFTFQIKPSHTCTHTHTEHIHCHKLTVDHWRKCRKTSILYFCGKHLKMLYNTGKCKSQKTLFLWAFVQDHTRNCLDLWYPIFWDVTLCSTTWTLWKHLLTTLFMQKCVLPNTHDLLPSTVCLHMYSISCLTSRELVLWDTCLWHESWKLCQWLNVQSHRVPTLSVICWILAHISFSYPRCFKLTVTQYKKDTLLNGWSTIQTTELKDWEKAQKIFKSGQTESMLKNTQYKNIQ